MQLYSVLLKWTTQKIKLNLKYPSNEEKKQNLSNE